MLAVNYSALSNNFEYYCDKVIDSNETLIVTHTNEKNVVIIGFNEWSELQRTAYNLEYLKRLNRSIADINAGSGIIKTIDELDTMLED